MTPAGPITAYSPDGVPEVRPGDDLLDLLLPLVSPTDGDVVVVTSKVVSKAEGRVVVGAREDLLAGETVRVLARRGPTSIVRTRLGLTMAAAGIDGSNVAAGHSVLLPEDPDRVGPRPPRRDPGPHRPQRRRGRQRHRRARLARGPDRHRDRRRRRASRSSRYAGRRDAHGNELAVTAPAIADEVAGLAELASGKLGGRPFTVVGGLASHVLPPGDDGPGAAALVRPEGGDLFGWGAREAVVRALLADPEDRPPFGAPAPADELAAALERVTGRAPRAGGAGDLLARDDPRVRALAFAHGWQAVEPTGEAGDLRLRPVGP